MDPIAKRKLHIAPLARQERAIRRLIREGKVRNATELVRRALDHYFEHIGRPTISEQARAMADELQLSAGRQSAGPASDPSRLQDPSRDADESW